MFTLDRRGTAPIQNESSNPSTCQTRTHNDFAVELWNWTTLARFFCNGDQEFAVSFRNFMKTS